MDNEKQTESRLGYRCLADGGLALTSKEKGNCHDNAVSVSFFSLLKKDRVKRKLYPTRQQARADIFDYIEGFYNPRRNHGTNGGLSPVEYERQYYQQLKDV